MPPLGLGYLAASVRGLRDLTVHVVDAYGEALDVKQATGRVLDLAPDVLGVSSTSFCFRDGLQLINAVKAARPSTVTLMGGYHPTMFDELLLKSSPGLDLILRGEADESLPELCGRLCRGEPLHDSPGLSYRSNGGIVRGIPQQIEDLDALPFPDRAAMNYDGYFYQFGGFYLPDLPPVANVVSSRSCPYHCTFCPKMFPEWRYRTRSAESVFQEVLELTSRGYEIVFFQDENFSHNAKRLEEFCRMVLDHNLDTRFAFQGTIHHLPDHLLQLMHQAGFDCLFVGVESGSDAQLRRFRKPSTGKTLAEGIQRAKRAHMAVIGFFIHGGPGETLEDSKDTQAFLREVRPHVAGASELSVQPGTVLWQELVGDAAPDRLDDTYPRKISTFPGQQSSDEISARRRGFQLALAKSWRHWTRAKDVLDLLLYNRSLHKVIKRLSRDLKSAVQLLKGGPVERNDPRIKRM